MRTETITVNYYTFDELSESAKEAVINKHLELFGYDLEWLRECCKEKLEGIGFINPEITYSLSYSQGDGVAFSADFDHTKLIDHIYKDDEKTKRRLQKAIEVKECDFSFYRINYHYNHENTYTIECNDNYDNLNTQSIIDTLLCNYIDDLRGLKRDLCLEFTENGYSEMEYQSSIEYMKELCEAGEYEFTENGELI